MMFVSGKNVMEIEFIGSCLSVCVCGVWSVVMSWIEVRCDGGWFEFDICFVFLNCLKWVGGFVCSFVLFWFFVLIWVNGGIINGD